MMPLNRSTTRRCLAVVGTPLIRPDGGRPNIAAKTLATLWYLLVLPDAQARLHRQLHHKRMPWYAPSRIIGATLAAMNICTMPLSWGLLALGRRNASRVCAFGVLLNPPSIMLSFLLVTELSSALVKRSCKLVTTVGTTVVKPFKGKEQEQSQSQPPSAPTPKPAEEKPAEEKPAAEKPVEDKSLGDKPTTSTAPVASTEKEVKPAEGAGTKPNVAATTGTSG